MLAAEGVRHLAAGRPELALPALRAALALGDAAPPTVVNLALAELDAGDTGRGRRLLRQVEAACPEWAEPPLRLAESLRAIDPAGAEEAYRRALDRDPARFEALLGLGAMLVLQRRCAEAQKLLLRACGVRPGSGEAWHALGLALLDGDAAAAESALVEAQRLLPDNLEVALHRVEAAVAAGNLEGALALLEAQCDAHPLEAGLHVGRGYLLERAGQADEAVDVLEAACALQPERALPHRMLGGLLARLMRPAQAEIPLRRAVELDPDDVSAANELAACLMRLQRMSESRDVLEGLVARGHGTPPLLCNLATALVSLGHQAEGVAIAREAVSRDEGSPYAWRTLANALPYCGDVAAQLEALRTCGALLSRGLGEAVRTSPDPDRRLRVGLMSGTLRSHPVGWLTLPGWEALDRERFELVCLGPKVGDPMARRFAAIASEWRDTSDLSDAALAELCRSLRLDLLVDLGGYGDAGRLPACALRLAPVQVKWVGMQFHSTGLPEMDWFLTDRWETPEGFEPLYTERLLRMPDGYVCYSPPPYAPDVAPLPALARGGPRGGQVTFGCFNNLAKMTPEVFGAWATVLGRIPGSALVLKTHQFADAEIAGRVRSAFAAHGIDPARLDLRGGSPHRQFLAEYGEIDIVLDPFPYSGGLTTCEALWMGVPTVTLPGQSFASRHTLSHQSNAGLEGWAAGSVEEYVDLAVRKASDLDALATLRAGLRAQVARSPLCDGPRFGRNLGAALRHAWQEWCRTQGA